MNFIKLFKDFLFNFFYPSFCKSCSCLIGQDEIFCSECIDLIKPVVSVFLPLTSTKKIKVFAVSDYQKPLKNLILEKFYSENVLASKQLGQLIYTKTVIKNLDIDYLIPVPLHWTRFAKRGYNQALVMANELSELLNIPVLDILKRQKRTSYQSKHSFLGRKKNVENAFCLNTKYNFYEISRLLQNKNIMLVDDLCTTGATLKNAAKILLKFGIDTINAVVACRVI